LNSIQTVAVVYIVHASSNGIQKQYIGAWRNGFIS